MTTDSKKEARAKIKRYLTERIATTKERMNDYDLKIQTADSRNETQTMKVYYASAHIGCIQHYETLKILDVLLDSLLDLSEKTRAKILNLDKTVQNIAEKTGVDISTVQTDIKELKETVGPNVKAVIQLFANLQKEEERRKKSRETMIV